MIRNKNLKIRYKFWNEKKHDSYVDYKFMILKFYLIPSLKIDYVRIYLPKPK